VATTIETTTRELREGTALGEPDVEVRYETTGHLSVRLLDASGTVPLGGRKASVEIPDEGTVELTSDDKGRMFHADVPFQDYELSLEDDVKVVVPAVAQRKEVHDRTVAEVVYGFVQLAVVDSHENAVARAAVELELADGTTRRLRSDDHGLVTDREPAPPGTCKVRVDGMEGEVELPETPLRPALVTIDVVAE
jgi:hypothetical protein